MPFFFWSSGPPRAPSSTLIMFQICQKWSYGWIIVTVMFVCWLLGSSLFLAKYFDCLSITLTNCFKGLVWLGLLGDTKLNTSSHWAPANHLRTTLTPFVCNTNKMMLFSELGRTNDNKQQADRLKIKSHASDNVWIWRCDSQNTKHYNTFRPAGSQRAAMIHRCHRLSQDAPVLCKRCVCFLRHSQVRGVCVKLLSRLSLHLLHKDNLCEILTMFFVNASQRRYTEGPTTTMKVWDCVGVMMMSLFFFLPLVERSLTFPQHL